jgi:hypothetical protein
MLDSLYDKRIELTLLLTGYYPVVIVGLAHLAATVGL